MKFDFSNMKIFCKGFPLFDEKQNFIFIIMRPNILKQPEPRDTSFGDVFMQENL